MARTGKPRLGVAATGAALLALVGMGPADAAGRYKTVTRTFSSAQPITIPSGGDATATAAPYPSEIPVGGLRRGKVLDANLTLKGFGHDWAADVDVMVSHRGVNRTVMSDVGAGAFVENATLTLDDEAASPMPYYSELATGTFEPTNEEPTGLAPDVFPDPAPVPSNRAPLSGFDGANPNGPWSLWVADDLGSEDGGQFGGGWSVTIKARVLR